MLSAKLKEAAGNGLASTLYVDDVFSTWLYTGNGSTQTITNGIDLSGQGGMVWTKNRNVNTYNHKLDDTARGTNYDLYTNSATIQWYNPNGLNSYNSNGYTFGNDAPFNESGTNFVSWTFRKAAKFFDVVTYTGTGSARTIAHNLGIAPGMVIVKRTDTTGDWQVYSNGLTSAAYSIQLNLTNAQASATTVWNSTAPTSSVFSVGTDATVNASGGTYVAYLFAHDTASDGIIQCGLFTTGGSGKMTAPVNLGWEPQYLLAKNIGASESWVVYDTLRGMSMTGYAALNPNTSGAEYTGTSAIAPTATGFDTPTSSGPFANFSTYIYMAIRRPNKPPTSGTQVYYPVSRSGTGATGSSTSFGQVTDLVFTKQRGSTQTWAWTDRLRGKTLELTSAATTAETAYANDLTGFDIMTGFYFGSGASGQMNTSGSTYDDHLFRRAPGFMDVVCYTGTGVARTVTHNLGVKPDLIIFKKRNSASGSWWIVYASPLGATKYLTLDSTDAEGLYTTTFNDTEPTSTEFTVGTYTGTNGSGNTFVSYLFATLAGISKVGSYTGNGTSQNIECGFAAGARFFLVKATSTTGSWWVWDSARGIVAGNDPALQLNSTAAEITTADAVDPYSPGITVNQEATCSINASGVSYVYLAIS